MLHLKGRHPPSPQTQVKNRPARIACRAHRSISTERRQRSALKVGGKRFEQCGQNKKDRRDGFVLHFHSAGAVVMTIAMMCAQQQQLTVAPFFTQRRRDAAAWPALIYTQKRKEKKKNTTAAQRDGLRQARRHPPEQK